MMTFAALRSDQCEDLIRIAQATGLTKDFRPTRADGRLGVKLSPSTLGPPLQLRRILAEMTRRPVSHVEGLEVVTYAQGAHYPTHTDGEWRTHTLLVYLNDDYVGGRTEFPNSHGVIEPRQGKAVMWENSRDGRPLQRSIHRVRPMLSGVKWVAVAWAWESPVPIDYVSGTRPHEATKDRV